VGRAGAAVRGLGLERPAQGLVRMVGPLGLLAVGQAAARGCAGPVGQAGLVGRLVALAVADAFAGGGVAVEVVGVGVQGLGVGVRAFDEAQFALVAAVGGCGVLGSLGRGVDAGFALVPLQQGIALQLALDEGLQLEIRQLQQL